MYTFSTGYIHRSATEIQHGNLHEECTYQNQANEKGTTCCNLGCEVSLHKEGACELSL